MTQYITSSLLQKMDKIIHSNKASSASLNGLLNDFPLTVAEASILLQKDDMGYSVYSTETDQGHSGLFNRTNEENETVGLHIIQQDIKNFKLCSDDYCIIVYKKEFLPYIVPFKHQNQTHYVVDTARYLIDKQKFRNAQEKLKGQDYIVSIEDIEDIDDLEINIYEYFRRVKID